MSRKSPPHPLHTEEFDDEPTQLGRVFESEPFAPEEQLTYDDVDGPLFEEDERTVPGVPLDLDSFEDSSAHHGQVVLDPTREGTGRFKNPYPMAPEPAQGKWRERNFNPRGVIPKEQLIAAMEEALQIAAMQRGPLEKVRTALRAELLPQLRQVVEQAGGDGIDAWLSRLLTPPGRVAKDLLLGQLCAHMRRFGDAPVREVLLAEAKAVCAVSKKAVFAPAPQRLSFRVIEKELEGRIEVDALLAIAFCSDGELPRRKEQVDRTLDSMRVQMRGLGGGAASGLMSNFGRLKVERRIVEAELALRTKRG